MESVWLNLFIDAWSVFHVTVFPDCVRPTIIVEWREFFVSYNWIILVMVWALGWRLLLINSLSMTDFSWKREFQFLELELELTHDTLATQGMATKIEFKQNKNKSFDFFTCFLIFWDAASFHRFFRQLLLSATFLSFFLIVSEGLYRLLCTLLIFSSITTQANRITGLSVKITF